MGKRKLMNIYLGGPIRITKQGTNSITIHKDDLSWRKKVKFLLDRVELKLRFFDPTTNNTKSSTSREVYAANRLMLDKTDIGVFNLEEFSNGHSCVGALYEIGYLNDKLVVIVSNNETLKNHTMLINCVFFNTLEDACEFLIGVCV